MPVIKKDVKITKTDKAVQEEYYDVKKGCYVVKSTPKGKNS